MKIKTCKMCSKQGSDGEEFDKKHGVCRDCRREDTRLRMIERRKTPEYRQWLVNSRELRRRLKEKYRRQKGQMPFNCKTYDSHVRAYIKHLASEVIRAAKDLLHDAHVKAMRSLSEADRYKWQYRTDSEFNANERIRNQLKKLSQKYPRIGDLMRAAIERNGSSPMVEELLGYSMADLRTHLEKQFTKGMTWGAFMRGDIHIDHITPKSTFNLHDDEEIRRCWCMSNLRPMWASANIRKGAKITCLI